MKQVASVSTPAATVRSQIDGWSFEDPRLLVKRSYPAEPGKLFIGYTPSPKDIPYYTCILEMLADGWELLGPPQREDWLADGVQHEQWSWWLQRPQQRRVPASVFQRGVLASSAEDQAAVDAIVAESLDNKEPCMPVGLAPSNRKTP